MYDTWSHVVSIAKWVLFAGTIWGIVPAILLILVIAYLLRRKPVERRRSLLLAACPLILSILMPIWAKITVGGRPPAEKPAEWVEVVMWGLFLLQIPILIMIVHNLRKFLIVAIPLVIVELWFGVLSWFTFLGIVTGSAL